VVVKKALVIEDDASIRANIVELLTEEGYEAVAAEHGGQGLALAKREVPALVICDIRMPEMNGFEVLEALRGAPETRAVPFIFLSAAADRADVRRGMNLGADDYVTKPFTRTELLDAVRARLERQDAVSQRVPVTPAYRPPSASIADLPGAQTLVLSDPNMRGVYDDAAKAAAASISVLVLGETGVGKEVLAQSIHAMSPRKGKPFLALNCAALSETLLEGELFGNERGAFTGAHAARPGLFEAAEGGTVFLDEVGELPMTIQVKLLRVLEERRVMRVGGRTPIDIDVRFVSATNRDLESAIAEGRFRQDLFFRLNGITLHLPPLRERPLEILPLASRFLQGAAKKLGRPTPTLSEEAAHLLARYSWPGNVRELKNVIERAVVLSSGDVILASGLPSKLAALPLEAREPPRRDSSPPVSGRVEIGEPEPSGRLRGEMEALERQRIVEALERCGGNQTAAAEMLGISRRTLVTRLGTYDLPRPRKRS
jgi:DNA-binding NtrC family response regulator